MMTPRIAIVLGIVCLLAPAFAAAQSGQASREERMDAALKDYQSGKPAQTASMPVVRTKSAPAHAKSH
ncbi:hypothetical protein [Variovorax sp. GT1P44]|uniref:hypothetical protein n=1 Tax=Variovorax sp. GT1P44 TaxID=3443742 RepID=UPI003F472212